MITLQIFYNLLSSGNLDIDRPIIRKIPSFVFMYSAKNNNSELGNFLSFQGFERISGCHDEHWMKKAKWHWELSCQKSREFRVIAMAKKIRD